MPFHMKIILAGITALVLSFAATPAVMAIATRIGAIDIPKDSRRVHKEPIPSLGGLAIYVGFVVGVLFFADVTQQIRGILFGSIIIVSIGVLDDIRPLHAILKFVIQIAAALIAVWHGVVLDAFSNPFAFGLSQPVILGSLAIPITVLWIVGITNSVNLIDGLDGLAVGVSTISSIVMLVIALMLSDPNVALIMAVLTGACLGFIPRNFNPAKIFMGDTGALFLGYILACMSILGLFKFYAVVSFVAPFLVLALPFFDTSFAFVRRLLKGKTPWSPDRGHFHHRLLDMGFNQKQAVLILYAVSGVFGLAAIIVARSDEIRTLIWVAALAVAAIIVFLVFRGKKTP